MIAVQCLLNRARLRNQCGNAVSFFHIVPRFDPPWLKDKSEMMSCVIVHGNKWAMVVATTMIALVVSAKNGSKKMKELYTVRHAIPL